MAHSAITKPDEASETNTADKDYLLFTRITDDGAQVPITPSNSLSLTNEIIQPNHSKKEESALIDIGTSTCLTPVTPGKTKLTGESSSNTDRTIQHFTYLPNLLNFMTPIKEHKPSLAHDLPSSGDTETYPIIHNAVRSSMGVHYNVSHDVADYKAFILANFDKSDKFKITASKACIESATIAEFPHQLESDKTNVDSVAGVSQSSSCESDKKPIPRYTCSTCNKKLNEWRSFLNHQNLHMKPRYGRCPFCTIVLHSISEIAQHRKRHIGILIFQCLICKEKFSAEDQVSEHITQEHPGEKIFNYTMLDIPDDSE